MMSIRDYNRIEAYEYHSLWWKNDLNTEDFIIETSTSQKGEEEEEEEGEDD